MFDSADKSALAVTETCTITGVGNLRIKGGNQRTSGQVRPAENNPMGLAGAGRKVILTLHPE